MIGAACIDGPKATLFPGAGGSVRRAHKLCGACHVHSECSYALEDPEIQGVWAGTTCRQRAGMRRAAG
jgi:hypothetical protein